MVYEINKDEVLAEERVTLPDESALVVGVYRYNGGVPKYGEKRAYMTKGGEARNSAIGRKTAVEMKLVMPIMQKMLKVLATSYNEYTQGEKKKTVAASKEEFSF